MEHKIYQIVFQERNRHQIVQFLYSIRKSKYMTIESQVVFFRPLALVTPLNLAITMNELSITEVLSRDAWVLYWTSRMNLLKSSLNLYKNILPGIFRYECNKTLVL